MRYLNMESRWVRLRFNLNFTRVSYLTIKSNDSQPTQKILRTYSLLHWNISLLGVRLYGPTEWGILAISRDGGKWIFQWYTIRFDSPDRSCKSV